MLQESDEAIVEFGLEAITLVEELKIKQDMDTSHIHTQKGNSISAATSTQYTAEFIIPEPLDIREMFQGSGGLKTVNITITGIKTPQVLTLQNSLMTTHISGPDEDRVKVMTESVEIKKLW